MGSTTTAVAARPATSGTRTTARSSTRTARAGAKTTETAKAVTVTAADGSTLTQADLKADVEDLLDKVVNGAGEHAMAFAAQLAAERTRAYQTHGVFKVWSLNNRLFLQAQVGRRKASVRYLFAGVEQWRKMNREVREGERPYLIWGSPVIVRRPAQGQQGQANQQPAQTPQAPATQQAQQAQPGQAPQQGGMFYRRPPVIEVYDWTQTTSTDPDYEEPDWDVPLARGDYATLRQLTESAPVDVAFTDLASRNENGWLDGTGITVNSAMGVGNQISTLAHELVHHYLGHLDKVASTAGASVEKEDKFSVRQICEQEAALGQWLVMKMLGLDERVGNDVTTQAAEYLQSWFRRDEEGDVVPVEGKKTKRKIIARRLDAAMKAADAVVAAFVATRDAQTATV